jgi:hypothetical protein
MNRITFLFLVVGLSAITGLFVSSGLAEPAANVREADAEKLKALQLERREVLRLAVKQAEESYRAGVMPYTAIPRTTINLLYAELDLAPDRAGRIAVRERMVTQFKEIESAVAAQVEAVAADSTVLLEAKAARLQAEIDLLREPADGK